MEEGPQIERTVFHRDTCYREIHQRNFRVKRFPRKVCFDLGDVKVEKDIVTFNEEEDEDTLVEKDLKLNAARGILVLKHS